jgi:hypothetical protein
MTPHMNKIALQKTGTIDYDNNNRWQSLFSVNILCIFPNPAV